ncbi:transposase [Streptomyces sp. NPDC045470]|uniref:transposase n=1 Tax=Streptomyces sp. NPDC045470 TaxID=3155469 RepID=UPI00341003BE
MGRGPRGPQSSGTYRSGAGADTECGLLDSQSVRATERGSRHGYDGGKKMPGIKRHLLADTLGLVLAVCVSPADVSDRDGAAVLLARCAGKFPRLRHLWTDQGHRGRDFLNWVREETGITIQIVQREDGGFRSTWARADAPPRAVPRFAVAPRRWVIERSSAWLGRYRRHSKDYEYLAASQENAVHLATVMRLLHRSEDRCSERGFSDAFQPARKTLSACGAAASASPPVPAPLPPRSHRRPRNPVTRRHGDRATRPGPPRPAQKQGRVGPARNR